MRLICYPTSGVQPKIVPAPVERSWMDRTDQKFAYRCLPLNIANAHGWLVLNPHAFEATWDGEQGLEAVTCRSISTGDQIIAASHFGSGILTIHVNALFRTEPGYDLLVTGPFNQPKDAIYPLTGIVETDWAPFTFTMNWKFTRRHAPIVFQRNEPICMIFPVRRGLVEETEPEIRELGHDPVLSETYVAWARGRRSFNNDLRQPGSNARATKWQKHYFRGGGSDEAIAPDHRTKLRVKPFIDSATGRAMTGEPLTDIVEVGPTNPPRRVEPCFCGSGRRYKHCHGRFT